MTLQDNRTFPGRIQNARIFGNRYIYLLLARMEERGWLECRTDSKGGLRARKEYWLTQKGREVLALLRKQVAELYSEVMLGEEEEQEE